MSGEQSLACLQSWVLVWEQGVFPSPQVVPGPGPGPAWAQGRYSVQQGACGRLAAQSLSYPGGFAPQTPQKVALRAPRCVHQEMC